MNQLAALRMEDPAVFDEVHRFVFDLLARGGITGLRVDHVDGLFAPGDYLRRLQERAADALQRQRPDRAIFLLVEKILGADEQLSPDWPVHGTTGYEFAAMVNDLFVDAAHRARTRSHLRAIRCAIAVIARRSTTSPIAARKLIMHETMSGDINSLGHQLNRFSESNRHFRDFTLYSLIATLKEVIACFPVYRTYVTDPGPLREQDRRYMTRAIREAKRRSRVTTTPVFDFIERMLLQRGGDASDAECEERARFIGQVPADHQPGGGQGDRGHGAVRLQPAAVAERSRRRSDAFGLEPARVHEWMLARQGHWPGSLSATSTHDTKRGEDVRARLNVLSELPGEWKSAVLRVARAEPPVQARSDGRPADAGTQRGVPDLPDAGRRVAIRPMTKTEAFRARMKQFVVKAMREAKVHTSWLSPDEDYERAVLAFVERLLDARRPFLAQFRTFQARIAEIGIYNSLAQLVIKFAAPGVPDFYQGTELWDLSLVDPDNRRPVDYEARRRALDELRAMPPGRERSRRCSTPATTAASRCS